VRPPISHHSVYVVTETCRLSVYNTHVHVEHTVDHGHEISTFYDGL